MRIDNEFTVGAPIEQAWTVLTDLEGIAPCLPGAVLTGRDGDSFRGKVKIKVGPVTTEYAGTASFVTKDEQAHHAVIDAKGKDARGAGNATAVITADLVSDGGGTKVTVSTDLTLTGRIAQFGSGMIQEVSRKLLGQFVACLETKLATAGAPAAASTTAGESSPAVESTTAPPAPPAPSSAPAPPAEVQPAEVQPAEVQPAEVQPAEAAEAAEPAALDVLALSRGALAKRVVPLVAGLVILVVVVYLLVR